MILTLSDAIDIADSHFRTALDAYAHSLYPASLARTFEQKGKTDALAVKLIQDEAKWRGILKEVEDCIGLLKEHKLEHKTQSEKAKAEKQTIPRYEPPDEEELLQLLPREYIEFVREKVPPSGKPELAEPGAAAQEPLEAYEPEVPERLVVEEPAVHELAADETPVPVPSAPPPEPPAPQPRKGSWLGVVAACAASILAGAAIGYFAHELLPGKPPAPPPQAAPPLPLPPVDLAAKVEMIVNGKSFAGNAYEAAGKVTVRVVQDKLSVTIYVTTVAEPKPKPAPPPQPKAKPKPRDGFPTGWEVR